MDLQSPIFVPLTLAFSVVIITVTTYCNGSQDDSAKAQDRGISIDPDPL